MSNTTLTKGILGIKRDPKRPLLFGFGGEMWPSDDSEDSDYIANDDIKEKWQEKPQVNSHPNPMELLMDKSSCSILPSNLNCTEYIGNSNNKNNQTEDVPFQLNNSDNVHQRVTFSLLLPDIQTHDNKEAKIGKTHSHKSKKAKKKKKKLEDKEERKLKKKKKKHDNLLSLNEPKKKKKKHKKSKNKEMELCIENNLCNDVFVVTEEGPWGSHVPENVLIKIFSYVVITDGAIPFLPRMSKVCRLWYKVAQCPSLWENVDLSWGRIHFSEFQLIKLCSVKQVSFAREFNFSGWGASLTQRSIEAVVEHCPLLSTINLSRCIKISADCIRLIADRCSKLSNIDLSGTCKRHSSTTSPVSPASLRHLVTKSGEHLSQLYIAENDVAGFTSIIKLIS
ncbi:F-box and leucine-rich repeat protein 13-like, partial [Centruroides vittatus]|uniref:F-box and leucine-rich repeat protein 13-like n=1 Tax=Centruroides vittatus TaxID=120091 RepID=UPI00351040B1